MAFIRNILLQKSLDEQDFMVRREKLVGQMMQLHAETQGLEEDFVKQMPEHVRKVHGKRNNVFFGEISAVRWAPR